MTQPNADSQIIATIDTIDIINQYIQVGINVEPYFKGVDKIFLLSDRHTGLMQWQPSIIGDGGFYSDLSKNTNSYYPDEKNEYQIAQSLLNDDSKVIEIGCGQGHFAPLVGHRSWYGVDINPDAVDVCKMNGFKAQVWNFFEDKLDDLGVSFSDFDFICSFQTLEHFAHPDLFFSRLSTIMDDSQRLIIAVPSHDSILGVNPYTTLNLPPHHQTLWSDHALRQFPNHYGFNCLELIHCDVDSVHKQWFFQELMRSLLLQKDFFRSKPINSLSRKLINRLVHYLSKYFISHRTVFDSRFGLRGQSVIGVYSKIT